MTNTNKNMELENKECELHNTESKQQETSEARINTFEQPVFILTCYAQYLSMDENLQTASLYASYDEAYNAMMAEIESEMDEHNLVEEGDFEKLVEQTSATLSWPEHYFEWNIFEDSIEISVDKCRLSTLRLSKIQIGEACECAETRRAKLEEKLKKASDKK